MEAARRAQEFIKQLSTTDLFRILSWARYLGHSYRLPPEEASDIVNEAIVRLLERNPYLDSEEGFRRYLAIAIRNIALDLLRLRKMETRHGRVDVDVEAIEQVSEQVSAATPQIELRDVEKLLDRLSPRELEVAHLTLEGYESSEIAKRLAIAPATVRSLLRRIRARFVIAEGNNHD